MRHGKKILSLALTLTMALSLLPGTALAADDKPERGTITYTEVIKPQYQDGKLFAEDLAAVEKNGKWGFIDHDGKTVIPFQYDYAWSFNEGYAIVAKSLGGVEMADDAEYYDYTYYMKAEIGFIDKDNNYTAFTDPNANYSYSTGYSAGPLTQAFYRYVETWSWTDDNGVEQSERDEFSFLPEDQEYLFHNGVVALDSGEYGEISTIYHTNGKGYPIKDADGDIGYAWATGPMNEGLIPVQFGEEFYYAGYVDAYGNMVKAFGQEFFGQPITDEWGWTDQSFHHTYYVSSFNQGLAAAFQATYTAGSEDWGSTSNGIGFIDRNYNWVVPPQYHNYWCNGINTTQRFFGETGLATVSNGQEKYGAIDKTGKTVIPFQYDDLLPVSEGRVAFAIGGKWGYLDAATLEVLIPAQYENVSSFSNGLAVAYNGSKAFLIDWNGVQVPGANKLDASSYFYETADGNRRFYSPDEYVLINENGKYGYGHVEYLPNLPAPEEMSGWSYKEVVAAIEEDLIPTYLQNLYLNNITRGEFCDTVIQAITETLDTDVETLVKTQTGKTLDSFKREYPFTDTTSSNVIAAYALGIVQGRGDGTFGPYATITRQEAAAFLTRGAKVLGMDTAVTDGSSYADGSTVAVWAKDSVDFVSQIKVMSGTGNNSFTPTGTYTREQSYVTIYRLYQAALEGQQ